MPIAITITPSKSDEALLRAGFERLLKVGGRPRRVLGRIGLFVRREAKRLLRERPDEWGPSSGRLSASLAMRLEEHTVSIGSNLRYAAIQQLGGTVAPKGHPYLAIPVAKSARRAGVWPRDIPKGQMKFKANADIRIGQMRWTGPALVRVADGEGQRDKGTKGQRAGEVMFALVKQARIKGRVYLQFSPAARAFAVGEAEMEYRRALAGGH